MSDEQQTQKEEHRSIMKAEAFSTKGGTGAAGTAANISNLMPDDPFLPMYGRSDILQPPYDAQSLTTIIEQSSILPQCVDAMVTNIDGFGYTLDPIDGAKPNADGKYSPEAEKERARIRNFFKYVNPQESFTRIRSKARRDYEVVGYSFWEVLRNGAGLPAGLEHAPAYTMRLCKTDMTVIYVKLTVTGEDGATETVEFPRRFRKFVQQKDSRVVWFREFGDPREMDATTGDFLNAAQAAEVRDTGMLAGKVARLATEILFFYQYSSRTPYGIPRWIGALPAALGERAADEINLAYFDNKGVPPLAVLVEGRLAPETRTFIQEYVEKNIKGRDNFHSILVLEVEAPPNPMSGGGSRASVKLQPLTEAIQKDSLFKDYRKDARDNVRSSFRLPKIFVGETDDYNRATADASRDVANEQIFGPERDDFDFTVNRVLFPALGILHWQFKSLAATQDNATSLTEIIDKLAKTGLTAREARKVMAEIFNKELTDPTGEGAATEWLDLPLPVYVAQLTAGLTPSQVAKAESDAAAALKAAQEAAKNQPPAPAPGQPGKPGQPGPQKGIVKSEGIAEMAAMLIELRKAVLEQDEPTRTF